MILKNAINKIRNEVARSDASSETLEEIWDPYDPSKRDGETADQSNFLPTLNPAHKEEDSMPSNCAYPAGKPSQSTLPDLAFNLYPLDERSNISSPLNLDLNASMFSLNINFSPSAVDITCPTFNSSFDNSSDAALMYPNELRHINMTQLISYAILFPLAAIGNLLVFVALFRNRHRKSRVNLMLLHLSLADMIVTFIFLPTEIIWHINIEWVFGNIGCKVRISGGYNCFYKIRARQN